MRKATVLLVLLGAIGCTRFNVAVNDLERYAGGRAFWSFLLPGVGQIQNEEGGKATMLLALEILNITTYFQVDEADRDDERLYAVAGVLRLWSASDAFYVAKQFNQTKPFGVPPPPGRAFYDSEPAAPSGWTPLQIALDPFGKRVAATLTCRF